MNELTEMYCIVGQMGGSACFFFETVHFYIQLAFWLFFSPLVLSFVVQVVFYVVQSQKGALDE